jgi:hypothetical protein
MEILKLELGMNGHVFSHSYALFGHLATQSWIQFTWQICEAYNIARHDNLPPFPLRRAGDLLLMEAIASKVTDQNTLVRINKCQLYLQVITLADICTADGKSITRDAWDCKRNTTRNTAAAWPKQGILPTAYRDEWRTTLRTVFRLRRATLLPHHLGPYYDLETTIQHFFSPSEDWLYEQRQDGVHYYRKVNHSGGRSSHIFEYVSEAIHQPSDLHRATVSSVAPLRLSMDSYF